MGEGKEEEPKRALGEWSPRVPGPQEGEPGSARDDPENVPVQAPLSTNSQNRLGRRRRL